MQHLVPWSHPPCLKDPPVENALTAIFADIIPAEDVAVHHHKETDTK